ncbi:MAG: MaoC/PaaZ C-terminal domain-containing protein [Woeseiaceae bacterium]|nr:MaoC/PaaZ C-terminal domain-containing protein [Woeseiaceae bacterium]
MSERKRFYEDLEVGKVEVSTPMTVDRDEMIEFARRFDPQYFHADEAAAAESRFGDVIASGQYTMVLWRQLDHRIAHDIAWICGVGWDDVRWPLAVRGGDELRARSCCLDKRLSNKDPGRGVVRYRYELLNQDDDVVFSCVSTNLVETRTGTDGASNSA